MAAIDQTANADKTICWARGDSDAKVFQVTKADGVTPDSIAGRTYRMTVSSEKNPTDVVNQQFTIVGLITDAANGFVEFMPTVSDTDIPAGKYFYDIEETNGAAVRTMMKGICQIIQDISK